MDDELLTRTRILLGQDGIEQLQRAHVLIAGLGGVGSFAAEALCRAGIGRMTLIDHDRVAPSNLNRQLLATLATIGQKKVAVMGERLASIHPACQLDLQDIFLTAETIPALLDQLQPDWVVDAIDSLNSKVNLIIETYHRGIPIISSMGAGGRLQPTGILVGDIMDTQACPLARVVRKRLRRRGLGRGILAVWTLELPKPPLPPEPTELGRDRAINGTISYMPAMFGLTMAGTVIQHLLGQKK